MHMNSVPQHLLSEDRQEYERILGEVLRSAPHRPEFAAGPRRLNSEQLRTMALNATAIITASAAAEYEYYVKVRDELRNPPPSVLSALPGTVSGSTKPDRAEMGPSAMSEAGEAAGAGAGAVAAVLAPVLAGTAAGIFLLVGYVMKAIDPDRAIAQTLLTTGWVFGAVTAAAILVAAVGLLLTALRNGATAVDDGARSELAEEVARAKETWREALLERGILPFLRDALTSPGPATMSESARPIPPSRMPHLGYNRPSFSSPDSGGSRTGFTSPDFTSPDFGGPEHQPE